MSESTHLDLAMWRKASLLFMQHRLRVVVAVLLAASVGACSPAPDNVDSAAVTTGDVSVPTTELDSMSPTTEEFKSPEDLLQALLEPGAEPVEDLIATTVEIRIQDSIARCMATEGWEYIAYVPPPPTMSPVAAGDVSFSGFGVVDSLLAELDRTIEIAKNPNNAIVEEFTNAEYREYMKALWGAGDAEGCAQSAYQTVVGSIDEVASDEELTEFEEALNDINIRVESDPDVVASRTTWSACIKAETGVSARSELELWGYIASLLDNAVSGPEGVTFDDYLYSRDQFGEDEALTLDMGVVNQAREFEVELAEVSVACGQDLATARERARRTVTESIINRFSGILEKVLSGDE